MNGNPYYVDPWGGYNEGMKNLGSAFDTHQENRRKDELLKIQQAEEARKQAEYAWQEETRQRLGAIDAKRSEMTTINTPNPEFQNYQTLKAATMGPPEQVPVEAPVGDYAALGKTQLKFPGEGIQLPAQAPPESLARTEQVYGNSELDRQKAQYLSGRADWKGLDGMEKAIDVTSKVDARSTDAATKLLKMAVEMKAQGATDDAVRAQYVSDGDNINRLEGKQVIDVSKVKNLNFSPRGDVIYTQAPTGQWIASTLNKDGTVKFEVLKPAADDGSYKQRTRPEGRVNVFEESMDGGRTWREVSRGDKDNPNGGRPSITIVPGAFDDNGMPITFNRRTNTVQSATTGKDVPPVDVATRKSDFKADSQSLANQTKQADMMGSFVTNMSSQIDKVEKIGKELSSFDSRILNVPLRAARGRIAGSANQAKYDMYITEIESEIGKLATGSSASVAELSAGAQERWAKIHDKNLSIADMLSLLKETKQAGIMRRDSVKKQMDDTKKRIGAVDKGVPTPRAGFKIQSRTVNGKTEYREVPN